ncbi:lipase family alpha/beta hydrolase [Nonomuraea basaltis]|uniref:lipase family alpha/beta hydrolase n=1 Tax=Nonomuraea basaltis TaxID=2495887 RepID=UPI00110C65F6|nr:hypothetical protein [Nonomuraea basaltis]TMR88463.1 hypothetical protein EJK15_66080 [Nonomuraea basaltis]
MSTTFRSPGLVVQTVRRNVSQDAVVVVPGIMGSVLKGPNGVLWGFRLGSYARLWSRSGSSLNALALSEDQLGRLTDEARELTTDEIDGRFDHVAATGLLKLPAYAPFLHGFEPYDSLIQRVGRCVAHPDAILEFAYDWRLPVAYNARRLAVKAADHLQRWRAHPDHEAVRRLRPDGRPARLVFVAHSMGGLLCRALERDGEHHLDIRATITLGTPFDGAVKAAMILSRGEYAPVPLPRQRLHAMATTLPGIHDLLPCYRCVEQDDDGDPRRLTPTDVAEFGGHEQLAAKAFAFHQRTSPLQLVNHHALVGTAQPTLQSLSLRDGLVIPHRHTFQLHTDEGFVREGSGVLVRIDDGGDGTVPRSSATLGGLRPSTLPQQHGSLARASEAVQLVCDVITERDAGAPRLGEGELGLEIPDVVAPGTQWSAVVSGVDSPNGATCLITDAQGRQIDRPRLQRCDGRWQAAIVLPDPGIFRVIVEGGGTSAITQLVLAHDDGSPDD